MTCISVVSSAGLFPLWFLPVSRSTSLILKKLLTPKTPTISHPWHPAPCSAMIILNAIAWIIALLKLDLNPIPHFTTIPFHPGDLNTDQLSFCRYFHSLTFLQGWHLCVQLLGASQDDVSDVSISSKSFGLKYLGFTWSKPGNQSLRASAV